MTTESKSNKERLQRILVDAHVLKAGLHSQRPGQDNGVDLEIYEVEKVQRKNGKTRERRKPDCIFLQLKSTSNYSYDPFGNIKYDIETKNLDDLNAYYNEGPSPIPLILIVSFYPNKNAGDCVLESLHSVQSLAKTYWYTPRDLDGKRLLNKQKTRIVIPLENSFNHATCRKMFEAVKDKSFYEKF